MKKSKILVPALAVLTFSTAAAVTGTVAWYFAQRAVSVKATVTSFNPEAGLKVTLTAGVGNTVPTGKSVSGNTATPAEIVHDLIRDGSVDLATENVYAGIRNRKGDQLTGFEEIAKADHATKLKAGSTADATPKDYYYATKYTAKFELTKKDSDVKYALYYDNSLLEVGSGTSTIQEALRIGFVMSDGSYFVVAPYRNGVAHLDDDPLTTDVNESETAVGIQYVKNTSFAAARGDYDADGKVIYGYTTTITEPTTGTYAAAVSGTPVENLVDGENQPLITVPQTHNNIKGFMGDIEKNQEITVTVYTWFEGEDPHSKAEYVDDDPLETSLGFSILEIDAE